MNILTLSKTHNIHPTITEYFQKYKHSVVTLSLILCLLISIPTGFCESFNQEKPATPYSQWKNANASTMKMPAFLRYSIDSDTQNKVWRLGGSQAEMYQQLPFPQGKNLISLHHAQHFYSRTVPTNKNETYILGSAGQNKPNAALWRLSDKQLVAWVPSVKKEAHLQQRQLLWDKKQANTYWYTEANHLIKATINFNTYKVKTQTWETFNEFDYITFGMGEGDFSDDGSKIVIAGKAKASPYIYYQPYQIHTHIKYPKVKASSESNALDWVSVDPTGKYIVYTTTQPRQTRATFYPTSPIKSKPTSWLVYDDIKHTDFIIDKKHTSWMVYGNWRGLFAAKVSGGFIKRIWPTYNTHIKQITCENKIPCQTASGHISRVADHPGIALMHRMYDGGMYFINIDQPEKSIYLGNSRHGRGPEIATNKEKALPWGVTRDGETTVYSREARPASSNSGKYIFFTSDYQIYASKNGGYNPEPIPQKAFLNMIEVTK